MVELPPVVEIVPSTVPFETVQVEVHRARAAAGQRARAGEAACRRARVSVPSQVVPPANRICSALSATVSPPVSRSIRKDCRARRCR